MTDGIEQAAEALRRGGVVVYPTRTLWGLGGDARLPFVVEEIARLKGRAPEHPFLMLLPDVDSVRRVGYVGGPAEALIDAFWPGELTLLLPATAQAPASLVGAEGLVGVRLATHPIPRTLVEQTGAWLVSTSANLTGEPAPTSLEEVPMSIRQGASCVLEGGPPCGGAPSTIVALPKNGKPRLIRSGAVDPEAIGDVLGDSFTT